MELAGGTQTNGVGMQAAHSEWSLQAAPDY